VKVSEGLHSSWFDFEVGLRQGCPLSPTLFILFLDGLVRKVKRWSAKFSEPRVFGVSILLFADDVTLIAKDCKDLQALLDLVYSYSKRWHFNFNGSKSKAMIFGRRGEITDKLFLGTESLSFCQSVKFLGVDLTSNMAWSLFHRNLINRARKRMSLAYGAIGKGLSVEAAVRVWTYVIRSVLEYGAEVTGHHMWKEAELIQNEVGRRILAVSKSCANVAVRGELGWWTLLARRELLMLRFWGKIVRKAKKDSLLRTIYRKRRSGPLEKGSWCYHIRRILFKLGLGQLWETQKIGRFKTWINRLEREIREREFLLWLTTVQITPKLALYSSLKSSLTLEDYLRDTPFHYRKFITRLRCGSNFLSGRWEKLDREDRKCLVCVTGQVEDESVTCTRENGRNYSS